MKAVFVAAALPMRYIITVIVALTLSTACHAQVKIVSGVGAHSCGKYLAAVHGHAPGTGRSIDLPGGRAYDEHIRYAEWVLGFLTATNWWVIDERNQIHPDGAAVDVWIRK